MKRSNKGNNGVLIQMSCSFVEHQQVRSRINYQCKCQANLKWRGGEHFSEDEQSYTKKSVLPFALQKAFQLDWSPCVHANQMNQEQIVQFVHQFQYHASLSIAPKCFKAHMLVTSETDRISTECWSKYPNRSRE